MKVDRETVGCILKYDSKYLLLHRTKDGLWGSVAGSVISGETTYAAIVREIYEELSLEIDPKFFKTTYHAYDGVTVTYHLFYYFFDKDPRLTLKLNFESYTASLFTLDEATKLILYEDEEYCLHLFECTHHVDDL